MIFSTPIPPGEGLGFYVWNLAQALQKEGHEVTLATRGGFRPASRRILDGIPVWDIPFLPLYPFHTQIHNLFLRRWIRNLEPRPDILHFHSPLVPAPEAGALLLVTVHTTTRVGVSHVPVTDAYGILSKLQSPFSFLVEKGLFHRAHRLVATSGTVAREMYSYQINPETVGILGNGVDTEVFFPDLPSASDAPPYVFASGRLVPEKGWKDLLQCARIVIRERPEVRFWIAGSGLLEKYLKTETERTGLSGKVVWLGHIADRRRLADLYRKAAVFVHPSHYDGLSTSILEAMACARPVVVTSTGGAMELISDGENGLLTEINNPQSMAEKILLLFKQPELGGRLGKSALETIRRGYSWQIVSRKYISEYQALLERTRGK
jgi:glycosyltransferase involved in cell wall biosynthesis